MSEEDNPNMSTPVLTAEETQATIVNNLPPIDHHDEIVEEVGPNSIRLRLPFNPAFVGAEPWQTGKGKVFSGPMVMGFADTAMYCCVMVAVAYDVIPVMINLTISFVEPALEEDLIADARIVRRGGRLHYVACWLRSESKQSPCAHITSTYRVAQYKHRNRE